MGGGAVARGALGDACVRRGIVFLGGCPGWEGAREKSLAGGRDRVGGRGARRWDSAAGGQDRRRPPKQRRFLIKVGSAGSCGGSEVGVSPSPRSPFSHKDGAASEGACALAGPAFVLVSPRQSSPRARNPEGAAFLTTRGPLWRKL